MELLVPLIEIEFRKQPTPGITLSQAILAITKVMTIDQTIAMDSYIDAVNTKLKLANEQMNRFLGMAAHDLRNPLGAVMGLAEILIDAVGELLDISAIESGTVSLTRVECALGDLIQSSIQNWAAQAKKKSIGFQLDLGGITEVSVDRNKITQVLDNFISNAIKYSPANSQIKIHSKKNNDRVLVTIDDSGVGLLITKRIVEAHGGRVGYERLSPNGSRFFFELLVG